MALLGPLGNGIIKYLTSQSGTWQLEGNDLANLVLMFPFLLVGGFLQLAKKDSARYFLILTGTAVNTVALVEVLNPAISGSVASGSIIFPILGILVYASFFYLIREKLRKHPQPEQVHQHILNRFV